MVRNRTRYASPVRVLDEVEKAVKAPVSVQDRRSGLVWLRVGFKVLATLWFLVSMYQWYRFDGVVLEDVVWAVGDVLMLGWIWWR